LSEKTSCQPRTLPTKRTPHSLRHGHATALQAAGVDLKTISGRLGHSGVGITSRTYVHAVQEQERAAAEKAARRVRGH
jgi:integrase